MPIRAPQSANPTESRRPYLCNAIEESGSDRVIAGSAQSTPLSPTTTHWNIYSDSDIGLEGADMAGSGSEPRETVRPRPHRPRRCLLRPVGPSMGRLDCIALRPAPRGRGPTRSPRRLASRLGARASRAPLAVPIDTRAAGGSKRVDRSIR